MGVYRPLIAGIDTLEVGYSIAGLYLTLEELASLATGKENAQSTPYKNDLGCVTLRGRDFSVARGGGIRHKYLLTNDDLRLGISEDAQGGKYYPEVHAAFSSAYLWREGWKRAADDVETWVRGWADVCKTTIARSDLTLDVCGPMPALSPGLDEVVTRARTKGEYGRRELEYTKHSAGAHVETYRFGKNEVLGRMYDKVRESLKTHKTWFKGLWLPQGWADGEPVTRVEFQCRRKFLRQFGVNTVEDLDSEAPDLWKYLSGDWLTVREPNGDTHRNRWPVSKFWECVQNGRERFGEVTGVSRWEQVRPRREYLLKQLTGLMVTLGATSIDGMPYRDTKWGKLVLRADIDRIFNDSTFDSRIDQRAARLSSMARVENSLE